MYFAMKYILKTQKDKIIYLKSCKKHNRRIFYKPISYDKLSAKITKIKFKTRKS